MGWAVTLHIADSASPSTPIAGASITAPDIAVFQNTDVNGNWIFAEADDNIFGEIVLISKSGYISKSFEIDKAQSGTIQTVLLALSPHGTTDPNQPTGRGPTIKCFIVSATTGSSESVEVNRLRQLRDRVASASRLGDQLIDVIYREYYQFSPEIAAELEQDMIAQKAALWVIVRPLLAWYTLAGILAFEQADTKAVNQATQDVLNACPRYLGGSSITALLETIRAGEALPPDSHPLLLEFAPRIQVATSLKFASWAILDPLVRVWRSATDRLDVVDEVAQWLSNAPLEALDPPHDPKMLDAELGVLAGFFDFRPMALKPLGERLAAAWPTAASALDRAGFITQTIIREEE